MCVAVNIEMFVIDDAFEWVAEAWAVAMGV